jgi:D-serine deaminase-like pyridoxal phosphate-dependent protein
MNRRTIFDVSTPSLILDRAKLIRNLARMDNACKRNSVALRAHMKTAKSIDVARIVLEGHAENIAVSTLREAEYFADNGIMDIQYAVCILPDKLERVAEIQKRTGAIVRLITDSAQVACAIEVKAAELDAVFHVQIEIDCGENRTGIPADSAELPEIASILNAAPGIVFDGIMTHAGHSYDCRTVPEIANLAEKERAAAVRAADRVRTLGFACPNVSVGSTPTALHAQHLDGITEARAGVYMFGDVFQSQINSCEVEDMAVSVLTEVTSCRPALNCFLIDAGALALSKDRSTQYVANDVGFGLISDAMGEIIAPQINVNRVFQEHGVVRIPEQVPAEAFEIGTRLRVFPNHVCMTAAMYDRFFVVDSENGDGQEIIASWSRVNGW